MNNQDLTNEERQALIEVAKKRISQYRKMLASQNGSIRPRGGIEFDYGLNISLMEAALAALTAEPVNVPDEPNGSDAPSHLDEYEATCWVAGACWLRAEVLRLNTIDNTAQQYEALAGWKMVPAEPTWEMLAADGCSKHHDGQECSHHENRKRIWRAMLAAAPKPEDKC